MSVQKDAFSVSARTRQATRLRRCHAGHVTKCSTLCARRKRTFCPFDVGALWTIHSRRQPWSTVDISTGTQSWCTLQYTRFYTHRSSRAMHRLVQEVRQQAFLYRNYINNCIFSHALNTTMLAAAKTESRLTHSIAIIPNLHPTNIASEVWTLLTNFESCLRNRNTVLCENFEQKSMRVYFSVNRNKIKL